MSFDPGEWTESLRKEYVLVIEGFFTVALPLFSGTYRRAIKARTKVAEALSLIVRQRRKDSEAGEIKKDMLGALLAGDDGFSDEQIVDFLLALLVAGYETTSTIMTLAVKFLTETPLALAQLKGAHLQGDRDAVDYAIDTCQPENIDREKRIDRVRTLRTTQEEVYWGRHIRYSDSLQSPSRCSSYAGRIGV
uniref:Cytochrome P450 n=1 Tax=Fagus sylvatica TaxID=28930 RepID=A0A2N9GSV9_FAGSY